MIPPPKKKISLSPQTPTPANLSAVLFLWLDGWSRYIWCAILLNDNMDLHMLSLCTLVPEGPWCVFCATRHQVFSSLKHITVSYWYSDLIKHTHTHTHTHTAHSTPEVSRLTHPYKYISTSPVMCSQQLRLISKIYFPQCLFFSKIIHL